jgi:hypothetical protein
MSKQDGKTTCGDTEIDLPLATLRGSKADPLVIQSLNYNSEKHLYFLLFDQMLVAISSSFKIHARI